MFFLLVCGVGVAGLAGAQDGLKASKSTVTYDFSTSSWSFPNATYATVENASRLANHLASKFGVGTLNFSETGSDLYGLVFRGPPSVDEFFDNYLISSSYVLYSASDGSSFKLLYDMISASFSYDINGSLSAVEFKGGTFLGFLAVLVDSRTVASDVFQYESITRNVGDSLGIPTENLSAVSHIVAQNNTTVILSSTLFGFGIAGCNLLAATFDDSAKRLVSFQSMPFVRLPNSFTISPENATTIGRIAASSLYVDPRKDYISSDGLIGVRLQPFYEPGKWGQVPQNNSGSTTGSILRFALGYEYQANVTSSDQSSVSYPILVVTDIESGDVLASRHRPMPIPSTDSFRVAFGAWTSVALVFLSALLLILAVVIGPPEFVLLIMGSIAVPLYVRLEGIDALENFNRGRIYGFIKANSGCSFSDLKSELQFFNGSLSYHLMVLERMELIGSSKDGRTRRYYVKSGGMKSLAGRFLGRMEARVLKLLHEKGPMSGVEVARSIGMSRQRAQYNLRHLQRRRLVESFALGWRATENSISSQVSGDGSSSVETSLSNRTDAEPKDITHRTP